jgi:elongation factor Ts
MTKVSLDSIQKLRNMTGLGMLDCKKALEEAGGDVEKAIELLRKRGAALADKRADRETTQGVIVTYIHPGDQTGVLIEINCETDFVARTQDIKNIARDIAMHIAASKPVYVSPEQVDPAFIEKEKDIAIAQLKAQGKPEAMIAKIIEGKMAKIASEVSLLKQQFVKDEQKTVEDILKELSAKTGENIRVKRFARFEIGN